MKYLAVVVFFAFGLTACTGSNVPQRYPMLMPGTEIPDRGFYTLVERDQTPLNHRWIVVDDKATRQEIRFLGAFPADLIDHLDEFKYIVTEPDVMSIVLVSPDQTTFYRLQLYRHK